MDDRVRKHAEVLVDWSARIDDGDNVVVSVAEGAHELGVAVAEKLGAVGANVLTTYGSAEMSRAYLRAHDGEFEAGDHELALYENADSVLRLGGGRNTTATADVEGETQSVAIRASRRSVRARE